MVRSLGPQSVAMHCGPQSAGSAKKPPVPPTLRIADCGGPQWPCAVRRSGRLGASAAQATDGLLVRTAVGTAKALLTLDAIGRSILPIPPWL
jgi:hypothetical protein